MVDAGGPSVQTVDGVAADSCSRRVLPHLRHRRRARALTRRLRSSTTGAGRITHPRPVPPAVRSTPDRGPELDQRVQQQDEARFLICIPKFGSTLLADEQAKQLWSEGAHGFFIIDVTRLNAPPETVAAALARHSGGRYRTAMR